MWSQVVWSRTQYCRHFSENSASEGEISRGDLIRLALRSILSNAPIWLLLFYFSLAMRIFQSVLQIVTLKSLVLSVRLQRWGHVIFITVLPLGWSWVVYTILCAIRLLKHVYQYLPSSYQSGVSLWEKQNLSQQVNNMHILRPDIVPLLRMLKTVKIYSKRHSAE